MTCSELFKNFEITSKAYPEDLWLETAKFYETFHQFQIADSLYKLADKLLLEYANESKKDANASKSDATRDTLHETHNTLPNTHKKQGATFVLPDWVDAVQWDLWLKTRKGKKMLPEQMQAQIAKLEKWKVSGLDYGKALSDAAINGWQGLFEPKYGERVPKQDNFSQRDYGKGVTDL